MAATLAEEFWVVLHHALESCGRLENGTLSVCVFGIDKLRNDATTLLQGLQIVRDLKYERVCVSWEGGITLSVGNITLWVPFGF